MRPWWQDFLINTGGAALGAIIAAAVITVAGKVAGLFDSQVEFQPREFVSVLGALVGVIAALVTIVSAVTH